MCLLTNYDHINSVNEIWVAYWLSLSLIRWSYLVWFFNYVNEATRKMTYFCCAWEMVEWPHLNVASLSAGMQRRSLSHPWVLARITSDMIMFKGKAEWKRRDRQGITSEESLSMTYWLPRQSVKRPISFACPSLPVVPSPSVSHTTFSEGFEQLVAFSKDWQEII